MAGDSAEQAGDSTRRAAAASADTEQRRGPFENEIAEALYRARIPSISELARRIGMKREYLSLVVNGHKLPSAEELDAIAAETGWTREQLVPREEFRVAIEATRPFAVRP